VLHYNPSVRTSNALDHLFNRHLGNRNLTPFIIETHIPRVVVHVAWPFSRPASHVEQLLDLEQWRSREIVANSERALVKKSPTFFDWFARMPSAQPVGRDRFNA